MKIEIAKVFSAYPAGRFSPSDGEFTGERFRREHLATALADAVKQGSKIHVSLDGVRTFGSSFLEEAFGGLVRKEGFSKQDIEKHLIIDLSNSSLEMYRDAIWDYVKKAKPERANK